MAAIIVYVCRKRGGCHEPTWINVAIYGLAIATALLGLYIIVQFIRGEL